MHVRLVNRTEEAEPLILYCARVSSDQENTDPGLIAYLIKNKHWSPFEMAHMTVEIETSRAIAQQILRHRSFSFQEFSQRYARATSCEIYSARVKGSTNRQSSLETGDDGIKQWWIDAQESVIKNAMHAYQIALDMGIANEVARFLLPQSTTTKLYMCGSLRSWIHYLELRTDEHTQLEHREIAEHIKRIFNLQFPIIAAALDWQEGVID